MFMAALFIIAENKSNANLHYGWMNKQMVYLYHGVLLNNAHNIVDEFRKHASEWSQTQKTALKDYFVCMKF